MRGFGLIIPWRIDAICRNWRELHARYIEPYPCPATKPIRDGPFMTLTICPHHSEYNSKESRDKIKEDQKKCPDYPKPSFFLDGYCYHYRPPTGHCDLLKGRENDDKNES
jgi:hypothetical protein